MSAETIANFEQVKVEIVELEKKIQDVMEGMVKQQNIQMERCNDYGQRGFSLVVYFDDINLASFRWDNIKPFTDLLEQYRVLRMKQKLIEHKLNSEWSVEKKLKASVERGEV